MPQGCGCCADPAERSLLLAVGFGCTELSYPEVGLLLCLASPSAWSLAGGKGHWGTAVSLSGQRGWGCCQAEPIQQQCWHWLKPGAPRGATPSASAMGTSVCFWSKGNVTQYSLQHAWQAVSQGHGGEAGGGGGGHSTMGPVCPRGGLSTELLCFPSQSTSPSPLWAVGCGHGSAACCCHVPPVGMGTGLLLGEGGGGRYLLGVILLCAPRSTAARQGVCGAQRRGGWAASGLTHIPLPSLCSQRQRGFLSGEGVQLGHRGSCGEHTQQPALLPQPFPQR